MELRKALNGRWRDPGNARPQPVIPVAQLINCVCGSSTRFSRLKNASAEHQHSPAVAKMRLQSVDTAPQVPERVCRASTQRSSRKNATAE
jgi:hypothetical protein